jgi:DNA repair photolyase
VVRGPIVNDNRHSQLSLATKPAQVRITDLEKGAGPAMLGRAQVKEIDSRRCLTDFTMGDRVSGVVWSINPYVGCSHSCRYCYVPDTMHMERNRWGSYVIAKHNLPQLLRSEVKRVERKTVYLSTSTDPYQSIEREKRITRRCLQILAKHDWPVEILTRSPLVLRDTDLFAQFGEIRIGMSVPTLDDGARRVFEPAAPAIPSRLAALRKLADRGFTTFVNYTPAYPFTGGITAQDAAETFAAAGVKWVNTSYWIRMASYLGTMFDKLRGTDWADIPRFIGDESRQAEQRKQLAKALKVVNIPLRTGFFNPPFEQRERIRLEMPIESHLEAAQINPELCIPTGPVVPGSQWGPIMLGG